MAKALELAPRNRSYHHSLYDSAVVFALIGKPRESVGRLAEAAANGFESYPLLVRDHRLDPIRTDPGIAAFLAEAKARWEHFKAAFEAEAPAR